MNVIHERNFFCSPQAEFLGVLGYIPPSTGKNVPMSELFRELTDQEQVSQSHVACRQ
jgi:hypothetical protein